MTPWNRVLSVVAALALPALARGLSPEEAKQLGNELTAVGAERAGNADGNSREVSRSSTGNPPSAPSGGVPVVVLRVADLVRPGLPL